MVIFMTLFFIIVMQFCEPFYDWKICEAFNNHPFLFIFWLILVIMEVFNFCKKVEEISNKNKTS